VLRKIKIVSKGGDGERRPYAFSQENRVSSLISDIYGDPGEDTCKI